MTSDVIAWVLLWAEGVVVEILEGNTPMPAITLKLTPFLRLALLGDAAASGATGLLLATAAGPLAPLLGLPEPLLRSAGLVLLPYAAAIARRAAARCAHAAAHRAARPGARPPRGSVPPGRSQRS